MKKNILILGLMTLGLTFTSCSSDDTPTIPEGTSDATVAAQLAAAEASEATYSSANSAKWTQYARAVSALLRTDATSLYDAWNTSFNGGEAYKDIFTNPGEGKTYESANECIEEIIDGCIDIVGEVGESKIGDPRAKWEAKSYVEAVYAVESWYSYHSITDYANNIRSIQNAINCTYNGKQGSHNIAAYLNANDEAALANQLNAAIDACIAAIEGITAPFRSHIGSTTVVTAMEACGNLEAVLETLKAKVDGFTDEAELKAIVSDYVNVVVLPTYSDLKDLNIALDTAIGALAANPSNATFEAAANAWMASRTPWESSEAFLFGPVAELGLDPNMDSWPLDQETIKNMLNSDNFDELKWAGEYIPEPEEGEEDKLTDEQKAQAEAIANAQNRRGFHTLEFLLFKDGKPRTIQ